MLPPAMLGAAMLPISSATAQLCASDWRWLLQNLREQAVMLMHSMCKDCSENVATFEGSEMIELLARELQLQKATDPLLPNYFVLELVSIFWTVVVPSSAGLHRFLLAEGDRTPAVGC